MSNYVALAHRLTPDEALLIARRLAPVSPHLRLWVELIEWKLDRLSFLSQGRRSDNSAPNGTPLPPLPLFEELPAVVARELLRLFLDENGEPVAPLEEEALRRADRATWIVSILGPGHDGEDHGDASASP